MATTASDPLSPVPQVAQATAAAASRSLPAQCREAPGGAWPGPAGGDGSDRAPLGFPDPCWSLVGPSQQFLRALDGSVGEAPNRKRIGTQE